jgi:hypothetical protein
VDRASRVLGSLNPFAEFSVRVFFAHTTRAERAEEAWTIFMRSPAAGTQQYQFPAGIVIGPGLQLGMYSEAGSDANSPFLPDNNL